MQYPSQHSGLFSSHGADPREYYGPPNLRRARTPMGGSTTLHESPIRAESAMTTHGVSLADYDDSCEEMVNTPRSLRALRKVGIHAEELIRPTLKQTLGQMKAAKERTDNRETVALRHSYQCQMQQRKLKAAIEAYWSVCEEDALTPTRSEKGVDSTKVLNEEKQLRKIVETNKSRLRQQILRMQLLQKQRQREDERLEAQREADLTKKQNAVKAMAARSKREEEAAALRSQAREIEKQQMMAAADDARMRYEAQDSELKLRMEERRLALEALNAEKRASNHLRRERMKAQSEEVMAQRRQELEARMEAFEHEHQARLRQKEIEQARKRSEAEARAAKIRDTISRSEAQMQAKVLMTEAKTHAVEQRLRDFAEERSAKRVAYLEDEMEKEAKRQETYEAAMQVQQERVGKFVERMSANEMRQHRLGLERERQRHITHELAKQRMMTKQDAVFRQKRVEHEQRGALMEKIIDKVVKIEAMKESHAQMKEQRKQHREEAERTRVKLTDVTPGPSDYVVTVGEFGSGGPQWKMGLPASAAGPRVVVKNQPTPGYDCSPGPAAYTVNGVDESRHRNRAAFSFPKADRFDYSRGEGSQSLAPN